MSGLFGHQPAPRSDGKLPVTITHLELAAAEWTRRGLAPDIAVDIVHQVAPTAAQYLDLYDRVGRPWLWYERRLLADDTLTALINRPGHELHIARHDGALVGYFELYENEIVFFGLTPDYIGRRVGPWLLDRAIERGFARVSEADPQHQHRRSSARARYVSQGGFSHCRPRAKGAAGPARLVAGHLSVAAELTAVP